MVGYADPCPHCGNNKRRRFIGVNLAQSGESHSEFTSPPPSLAESKSATYIFFGKKSPQSCEGQLSTLTPQIAVEFGRSKGDREEADSSEGSCSSTAASQCGTPARASPLSSPSVIANGTPETGNRKAGEKIKNDDAGVVCIQEGEREMRPEKREDEMEEIATVCVKCKCGRKQEFQYRQRTP